MKTMKIEVEKRPIEMPLKFPKLMASPDGDCVLIALQESGSSIKGIVLKHSNPRYPIGYVSDWPVSNWFDFKGTITLSND